MGLFCKKNLIGLPVETKSGMKLGKLIDLEINPESHLVLTYQVRGSRLGPGLFSKSLMINRQQVVSIGSKKMVVEDNILKEKELVWQKAAAPSID